MKQGGFTTAIRTDETDPFLLAEFKEEILKHRLSTRIGKGYILQFDQKIIRVHCNRPMKAVIKISNIKKSQSKVVKENWLKS